MIALLIKSLNIFIRVNEEYYLSIFLRPTYTKNRPFLTLFFPEILIVAKSAVKWGNTKTKIAGSVRIADSNRTVDIYGGCL